MRFIKDQKVETNLRRMGIPYEICTSIPLEKIDWDEGIRRQTRLINKLDEDSVLTMALNMQKEDAAFPMIILQKVLHGLYWPWAGNHRGAAYKLAYPDAKTIDAYVVCIKDPAMMDYFPRVTNCWESQLGYSKENRIIDALWMMENHSFTAAQVAADMGLKVEWLYRASNVEEVKKTVEDVPGGDTLPKNVYEKLFAIHKTHANIVKTAVRVIVMNNLRSGDALHLISDIKKCRTENQMYGELARWETLLNVRKEPKKREKGTMGLSRPVRAQFLKSLTSLAKILSEKDSFNKLQITNAVDIENVKRSWNIIRNTMSKIEGGTN